MANYFELEDPDDTHTVAVELGVEATVDGMRLRGIIDRLDMGRREPGRRRLQDRAGPLGALRARQPERGPDLCPALRKRPGRTPAEVRLLYLRQPVAISSVASEQTIRGQRKRAVAVWSAIERACEGEDFRPTSAPCASSAISRRRVRPSPRDPP